MNITRYFPFFIMLLLIGCNGCDDEPITPMGEECRIGILCQGVAECNNGYCECPDPERQLAPGFCLQERRAATFVTFDQYEGLIDTMVISLNDEPFDQSWEPGDNLWRVGLGRSYNRNVTPITMESSYDVVTYKWPRDFTTPVDSVFIFDIFDKSNNQYGYRIGEWNCRDKFFAGKFTDRDHIVGEVFIGLCATNGTTPRPEELLETTRYPVTYTRVE
jgi:hypothetical protein